MIPFLKSKNKNTELSPKERIEPSIRSRRSLAVEEESESLIENPEVQKARHRLLGAGFLLFVAIIGLPRIFDSEPKKVKNDVVLNIVHSVDDSVSTKSPEAVSSPDPAAVSSSVTANATNTTSDSTSNETVIEQSKPDQKVATETNKDLGKQTKDAKESTDNKTAKSTPKTIEDVIGNPKAAETKSKDTESVKSRYYVQVVTLSSNDGAKKMSSKLKDLKISSYVVERKKDSEGNTLYQVRAGPFTSKEDAQSAVKKMSDLEVTPKIIEIKNNPK
jgi:DedD protein